MSEVQPDIRDVAQSALKNVAWFYGRFSELVLQNDDSIDQQVLSCRNDASKQGHVIPDEWVLLIQMFADRRIVVLNWTE